MLPFIRNTGNKNNRYSLLGGKILYNFIPNIWNNKGRSHSHITDDETEELICPVSQRV